jgi:hypothetical protein
MDVMIRLACDADVAALADLRRVSAFERFPEREDEGYGERFASWYEQEASRRLNWLAETDGTAVGMMNLVLFERMPRPPRASFRLRLVPAGHTGRPRAVDCYCYLGERRHASEGSTVR